MKKEKIVVLNPSGLHARPAGCFVKKASQFKSRVQFEKNGNLYNGKSILSVLSACVKAKEEIELQIEGPDEEDALFAITEAVRDGLGEPIENQ